jgi:hypothetical protein
VDELEPGSRIGRFEVQERLGRGGTFEKVGAS